MLMAESPPSSSRPPFSSFSSSSSSSSSASASSSSSPPVLSFSSSSPSISTIPITTLRDFALSPSFSSRKRRSHDFFPQAPSSSSSSPSKTREEEFELQQKRRKQQEDRTFERELLEEKCQREAEQQAHQRLKAQYNMLLETQRTSWHGIPSEKSFAFLEPQLAWQNFTGQSWDQSKGFAWLDAIHPEDRERFIKSWWSFAARGEEAFQFNFRLWSALHLDFRQIAFHSVLHQGVAFGQRTWTGNWRDLSLLQEQHTRLLQSEQQQQQPQPQPQPQQQQQQQHNSHIQQQQLSPPLVNGPGDSEDETEFSCMALKSGSAGVWVFDFSGETKRLSLDEQVHWIFEIPVGSFHGGFDEFLLLVHPDDREMAARVLEDSIANLTVFLCEFRIFGKDGNIKHVSSRGTVLLDAQKKPVRMMGICMDITSLRMDAQARLQSIQQAEEAQRFRAQVAERDQHRLEEFVNTICHEIRNPLNGLKGSLDWLIDVNNKLHELEYEGTDTHLTKEGVLNLVKEVSQQLQEAVEINQYCISHQISIVDDVLDYSKIQAGKMELSKVSFEPALEIQNSARMFRSRISEKNLKLSVHLPSQRWFILGDPARFKMIVINLLSNAIKFTKEGGIVIRMECERVRGSVSVRGAGGVVGGGGIRLSVSIQDSGFGMSTEQQKNLFEKFTQVGINRFSTYGGSGLGLLISKNLALLMDGDLTVESELGKGSTFNLTMTCEEGENCERRNSWDEKFFSIGGLPLAKTPLVALIVEDNPVNAKVLSWMLCKKGVMVEVAFNGAEAVKKLKETETSFDVCLMDVWLDTSMSGLDVAKFIRDREVRFPGITRTPIIGISGDKDAGNIQKALEMGFDDFVTKPFTKEVIWQKVAFWTGAGGRKSVSGSASSLLFSVSAAASPSPSFSSFSYYPSPSSSFSLSSSSASASSFSSSVPSTTPTTTSSSPIVELAARRSFTLASPLPAFLLQEDPGSKLKDAQFVD